MRIVCIGGGPAGLYFGLLMKKPNPEHDVTVVERNRPYDTFGWGVVFSDQTLGNLRARRRRERRTRSSTRSTTGTTSTSISAGARNVRSSGHGFCGIGRKRLLNILQARCEELGVKLVFETQVTNDDAYDADLIIACDGPNSAIRTKYAATYQPDIDMRDCRFVWLGTDKLFDAFTFAFEEDRMGLVPGACVSLRRPHVHVHRRDARARVARGRARRDEQGRQHRVLRKAVRQVSRRPRARCRTPQHLRGSAQWIRFPRVVNENWVHYRPRRRRPRRRRSC